LKFFEDIVIPLDSNC